MKRHIQLLFPFHFTCVERVHWKSASADKEFALNCLCSFDKPLTIYSQSRIWDGFSSSVSCSLGCSHQLELMVEGSGSHPATCISQWSPLVLETRPAGITDIQGCFCWKEETMLRFAGSAGRWLKEQRATSQKKRSKKVRWQQQKNVRYRREHAATLPKTTARKRTASTLRCHLWLIWLFLVPTYSFLP